MIKRKLISLATLALAGAFALTACSSGGAKPDASSGAGGAQPAGDDITVAGIVFQEDQFMKLMSKGYEDAAKDNGVKILLGNSSNDQAKELDLINTYLNQKVQGVAISPLNPETSIASLRKASEQGMKISITNMDLADADFISGGYTSDNFQLGEATGEAAAKYIKENLDGKAKVALVQFRSQFPELSAMRSDGFLSALDKAGIEYEVLADQDAWIQDNAISTMSDILTAHPEVNVVFTANDGGTIGSVMAIKNAGFAGKCSVFGVDIGEQQIEMLRAEDGILQAITGQDPYTIGYKAIEALVKNIRGEETDTQGKTVIVEGTVLVRGDDAAIKDFEGVLKERLG